jgi:hypothetical protein
MAACVLRVGAAADTADMWFKISVMGVGALVVPFSLYMLYVESHHEHHERHEYSHMRIRNKPFPWGDGQCDLLDKHCKAAHH